MVILNELRTMHSSLGCDCQRELCVYKHRCVETVVRGGIIICGVDIHGCLYSGHTWECNQTEGVEERNVEKCRGKMETHAFLHILAH